MAEESSSPDGQRGVESITEGPASALTSASVSTSGQADSRRTEDEAVTLPIPSSGLLTSPTQAACHTGANNSPVAWFSGGASPKAESHFSVTPLLSRGVSNNGAVRRSLNAVLTTSCDGAVTVCESPLPWPTPPHLAMEFGQAPSRACSSGSKGDDCQTLTRCRSSCGNLTLAKMAPANTADEEVSKPSPLEPAYVDFPGTDTHPQDQEPLSPERLAPEMASPVQHALQEPFLYNIPESPTVTAIHDHDSVLVGSDDEAEGEAVGGEVGQTAAGDTHNSEPSAAEADDLISAYATSQQEAVEPETGILAVAQEEEPEREPSALSAVAEEEGTACGSTEGDTLCSSYGDHSADAAEGPRWLTAEECAVSDAITQLQAVVSGLSEPYQRYIRERALELTRIIDENLQRQGLEPRGAGSNGSINGISTPSKKAATAAAALVLAVAASGTRWPYSTPGVGDGRRGGAVGPHADSKMGAGQGEEDAEARWLFRSPAGAEVAGQDGSVAASVPCSCKSGADYQQVEALSYAAAANSGSCTLCFGSVLGNSQAPNMDSADHTSGAISARAAMASHHVPSSSRPTPRSRSYSSFYAQQQSMRRNAAYLRATPAEPASAISSACSNAYATSSRQPSDAAVRAGPSRRAPLRPPPRGLGCGLGQPIKAAPAGSANSQPFSEQLAADGPDVMGYSGRPSLEPSVSSDVGRDQTVGPLTRRSRVSGQHGADPVHPPLHLQSQLQQQHAHPFDVAEVHGLLGQRRAMGRPAVGNTAGIRAGAGVGSYAQQHVANGRGAAAARGLGAAVGGPQAWHSARGVAAASEKQRADMAELELKSRKTTARAGLTAREAAVGAAMLPPPPIPAAHRSLRRRPAAQARQEVYEAGDEGDPRSGAQAAIGTACDARTSYQQLLRRSNVSRSSLGSARGKAVAASQRTSNPDSPALEREAAADASKAAAAANDWEQMAQPEVPYQLVQAFPALAHDVASSPQRPDWQPLHTALKLDELLASYPGDTARDSLVTQPETARESMQARPSAASSGGAANRGAFPVSALPRTTNGGRTVDLLAAPAITLPDDDMEPATAFVIVSRRTTREVPDDLGQSGAPTMSSTLDLSSLLPAPAWRHGRFATEPHNRAPGPGPTAGTTATTDNGLDSLAPSARDTGLVSEASECSSALMSREPSGVLAGRSRRNATAAAGGGAVIAGQMSRQASVSAGRSNQGRRWQLENSRMVVPDRDQMRAGSPVRPRYARNSDSNTSLTAVHKQSLSRKRDSTVPRDSSGGGSRTGRTTTTRAAPAQAAKPQGKSTAAKRPGGTFGTAARATATGLRSRSTPHARAAKTVRAARAHAASRAAKLQPAPAAVPLPQCPGTPLAPSSPPPPQQSQTPVHLQQQPQQQPAGGVRRWADDSSEPTTSGVPPPEGSGDSPTTPTRRRLHVHSPEDMPLSAAARQSGLPRATAADTTAVHTTVDVLLPSAAGLGLGLGLLAGLPPVAAPPPAAVTGAWGNTATSISPSPPLSAHAQVPPPLLPPPSHPFHPVHSKAMLAKQPSPSARGVSCVPLPSQRWAAPRPYTTVSVHTDGTTSITTSPGRDRAAWHHDCTPNILSPPRNYDRPWATPTRKTLPDSQPQSATKYAAVGSQASLVPSAPAVSREGVDCDMDGLPPGQSPVAGRRGGMAAVGVDSRDLGQGHAVLQTQPSSDALAFHGDTVAAGATLPEALSGGPAAAPGVTSAASAASAAFGPESHRNTTAGGSTVNAGAPIPSAHIAALAPPSNVAHSTAQALDSCSGDVALAANNSIPKDLSFGGSVATSAASETAPHRPTAAAGTSTDPMPSRQQQHALKRHPSTGGSSTASMGGLPPLAPTAPPAVARAALVAAAAAHLDLGAPGLRVDDGRPEPVDLPSNSTSTGGAARSRRTSSEGGRSIGQESCRSQGTTSGRRGGSGRPPTGGFRTASGLRAVPTGTGGAQLALVQQAAWPGLRDPRVIDALSTLEAGIAVLDPVPPPPPSSTGTVDISVVSASAPNGCFGLFGRGPAAAAPRVTAVPVPESVGQRPVLLKVRVADGAVELVLLRPRRAGAATNGVSSSQAGGTGSTAGATAGATQACEQRVRVAALSGLHPPLSAIASAAGDALDDLVDPASRWLQLVAMDGGVMKLSACSPADHARLVLGLNAGLLAAMGATGEEAPLAVVPLCRGLGGAP